MLKSFKLTKSLSYKKTISITKDIASILFFAVLTGLSANLKFEIGTIPITGQTLFVLLSGIFLGKEKGTLSQLIYLISGITGVPWFSRGGGLSYILSPTFGYLLGFIPASYIAGYVNEKKKLIIPGLLLAHLVIYFFGITWLSQSIGFQNAFNVGLFPFLIGDSLKILISFFINKSKN
jgi:biotin transporter BioY